MRRWLWMLALSPGVAWADPVLERVVIVQRHGVRAPTKPPSALNKFAADAWPDWPVAPGELTPHGAAGVRALGLWLRAHYASLGLFAGEGCLHGADVAVYADGKDHRTMQSGDAVLEGLAPGCGLRAAHGPEGKPDPVFTAMESGSCGFSAQEQTALVPAIRAKLAALPADYATWLAALRGVLDPGSAGRDCSGGPPICFETGKNEVVQGDEGPKVKGPLATGASLAQSLMLEYEQGMSGTALGWGRLTAENLVPIMDLHNWYSALTRRDPAIAGHNGAVLAQRVLAALDAKDAPKLTIFLGHDTNLDNMAGIFGLSWTLPGEPDATPPDGELVFERFGDNGRESVRVSMRYQTAAQLRDAAALTAAAGPGTVALSPAACHGDACTLDDLRAQLRKNVPESCVIHG